MRALLYVAPLREPDQTAEDQIRDLRAWLTGAGHGVVAVIRDADLSLGIRAGLLQALIRVRAGEADAVAVVCLDVVDPGSKLLQEVFRAELARAGGLLLVMRPPEQTESDREMLQRFEGVQASFRKAAAGYRMRDGLRRKVDAGGRGAGRAPFGLDMIRGEITANAREMAIVTRVLELQSGGLSKQGIADILTAEGYRTKTGSRTWHREQVRRIIERYGADAPTPARDDPD